MSASMGKHGLEEIDDKATKKIRKEEQHTKLNVFLKWCKDGNLTLNPKVQVGKEGSCAQYGMMATCDIRKGECLFEIPRSLLLTPENSRISDLLHKEQQSLESVSGWVPVLLALMYEYTLPGSRWRPYTDLVPDFAQLDLPMFWPQTEVENLLGNTRVSEAVCRDLENIKQEFINIVLPFVQKHSNIFTDLRCQDLKFYKQMVAFIMAYSFSEPPAEDDDSDEDEDDDIVKAKPPPMMVPMADILNHVAKNNAHLDFGKTSLKMVVTQDIRAGEEVFNTYGQLPNWQLLQMYGFAEAHPHNIYDTVEISMQLIMDAAAKLEADQSLVKKRTDILDSVGLLGPGSTCVLGVDGILNEDEMIQVFKVLSMPSEQLQEFSENEGWEEEEDDNEISLSKESIQHLPSTWKSILSRAATNMLSKYTSSVSKDEGLLEQNSWSGLSRRQQFSVHVRYGQKMLLQEMINDNGAMDGQKMLLQEMINDNCAMDCS